jgi:hypothetical protein
MPATPRGCASIRASTAAACSASSAARSCARRRYRVPVVSRR